MSSTPVFFGAGFAGLLVGAGVYALVRYQRRPKDKELRRRTEVNLSGRLGDATITEIQDALLYYSYSVRGVHYTASQDVSQLLGLIPSDPNSLIGQPASLKYSPQNPANSILICEQWSGLHGGRPAASA
jgi:hypothetical protein